MLALLLASLWTIPVGVAIGFHPKLAHITQPLAQIAASLPATALFPVILLGLMSIGVGIGIGSIALMMLGTQWYILFNVIAGAMAIPSDLKEVSDLFRFRSVQRWTTVILPGIFPYLITGLVTASGGAWNASIMAEYFQIKDKTLITTASARRSARQHPGRFPHAAAGDHHHGSDGGHDQSPGLASALPAGRNQIPAGALNAILSFQAAHAVASWPFAL